MSGAQASLVVNLASSIITVLGTVAKLYSDVKDASDIPDAFVESVRLLPVIRDALQTVLTHTSTTDVDEEACRRMQPTLERCIEKALQLETVLRRVVPRASTSRRDRYLLLANASGKDSHIEALMRGILEDVTLLAENPAVRSYTGTEVEKLAEAIRCLPARRPSMRDDAPKTPIINYSSGTINANTGSGIANNNTGSGVQYIVQNMRSRDDSLKALDLATGKALADERSRCSNSLSFATIDARYRDIAIAHQDTCEWIFKTSQFRQWRYRSDLQSHNGVLWIKGKPGAGKSTLMKHIWQHRVKFFKDHFAVAYFFNARGEQLEKTPLGMLRSITCQLIKQHDLLYERFLPRFREKAERLERWAWREAELKDFLLSQAKTPQLKPLFIHIDALDECREFDVRDVVSFLEDMSMYAISANVTLHICLSSRHYPTISMRKNLDLVVEEINGHKHDIARYVHNKLLGQSKHIETEVLHKAAGVFMWVVLVVAMLNRAYDEGKIEAMQQKLNELPGDLEKVFETLLNEDNPDKHETICMLQWVLFARRALTPKELYFGMMAGVYAETLSSWNQNGAASENIRRRIITSSRGLIEVRKGKEQTVQFIHESVNDFLLRNGRLQSLHPTLRWNAIGVSHDYLRACCLRYLLLKELRSPQDRSTTQHLVDSYPLLSYASAHIFEHAEEAQMNGIRQKAFVRQLLRHDEDFEQLRYFHQIFEQSDEMFGCKYGVTLLYMLSFHGHHELVKVILADGKVEVNAQGGVFGDALQAASVRGHQVIVQMLVEHGSVRGSRFPTGISFLMLTALLSFILYVYYRPYLFRWATSLLLP